MNEWLERSLNYAKREAYLDDLSRVYPMEPESRRIIGQSKWNAVEKAFVSNNDIALIKALLELPLFPIKDSYVAYFRRDPASIDRNPDTVARLSGRIRNMGPEEVYRKCSRPKETNRQIGPMFKRWCHSGKFHLPSYGLTEFTHKWNGLLDASDAEMKTFAEQRLGYSHGKGLDFIARVSGKYFIGEAKFLTDFGGHQNAQLNDALATLMAPSAAVHLAILDGVLFIEGKNKMYKDITEEPYKSRNIMSSLLLEDFLHAQE